MSSTTAPLVASETARYTRYAQILNALGALVALALGSWILSSPERRADPRWVYWLIWPMAGLHTIEEYIFPGGFLVWFNQIAFNSPDPYRPLTARRAFLTDAVAGLVNPLLLLLFSTLYFPLVFVFVFLLWTNASFHLIEASKTGKYSPGAVTALLLYVPGLSYVVFFYLARGLVAPLELGVMFLIGLGLHSAFFLQVRTWMREHP